jgi:hypothetical protein
MQQRQFLQRNGQIRRKEFMLSDRANWPSLPELTRQQMEPQMVPRGVPQQMAYPPQQTAGPPAKRARHSQAQAPPPPVPGVQIPDAAFDDDEDTSRGDMFDHMSPREISLGRYQQNHEWMEEVLSSPYRMNQITPSDLGLGLKGQLASLTEGIFSAPGTEVFQQVPQVPYVGRLDPGKADEFRKRVQAHVESEKKQMEELEKSYNATLAEMKQTSALAAKEKELRLAADPGVDLWQPNGASEGKADAHKKTVDDIVPEIESAIGKKVEGRPAVKCVQNGGYQPPAPEPEPPAPAPAAAQPDVTADMSRQPSQSGSQNSGVIIGESDIDMGGTAAGLLDQMHTGLSSTSTPVNNFPTPQPQPSAMQSDAATPGNGNVQSPAIAQQAQQQQQQQRLSQPPPQDQQQPGAGDVTMAGTEGDSGDNAGTAPDLGTGSGDWVVVPKEDGQEGPSDGTPAGAASNDTPKAASASVKGPSAAATPAVTDGGFDHNDFSSLGDLDTAGDALAGFDAPALDGSAGELGEGLDLQMDMEDSAFGDAFHGVDTSGTPGQDM